MTQTSRIRTFGRQLRGIAGTIGGAAACAAAAEAGRSPSRAALTAVGIDPEAYYGINRK
ncbi:MULTISPECIES: hypothetical protein [unclassified Aureimonas]|uniref:hypothetical protein n=1 Tax=unclassified Aureimonas TaxID=2615206 RepID=UPI000720979B|nr:MULTISPECIES: hypothetical protein [unclassified Aureimonas]ALN74466.1 hypothetical protein M673_17185 [Aureimonas sp. AU20]